MAYGILSEAVYSTFAKNTDTKGELTQTLSRAGFNEVKFFDNSGTGTQAFLAVKTGEMAVIAFRGTETNGKDIISDLNAKFYQTDDGKAHRGFLLAFESVEDRIRGAITALREENPKVPLFITGHSLGGALSTVATHALEKDFLVSACYTYGSPRVGSVEWSDSVKTPVYRIVNGADVVPMVPGGTVMRTVMLWIPNLPFMTWAKGPIDRFTKSGFVGFQHVGDMRFLQGEVNIAKLKGGSAASWARFRYVVVGKFLGALKTLNPKSLSSTLSDHKIGGYVGKLNHIANERNPRK